MSDDLDEYFPNNRKNKKSKIKDIQIADAILNIFVKRHSINIFNKKALYHNIKEIIFVNTGEEVTTPHITSVSEQMSSLYQNLNVKYQNGETPFKNVEENIFI
jgi:hypothetical protein